MKKIFAILLVFLLILPLIFTGCKKTDKNALHIYNWGEYIDPQIINDFKKETGIDVIYSTYASNEDLYIKLTKSRDNYDIVIPSDYLIERLIKEDLAAPIDFAKLKNAKNIVEKLKKPSFDPEGKYSVPYFWGTLGIIYNKKMVNDKVDSWDILWNEKYKNQIIMYNSQRDSMAVALKRLGYSLNTKNKKELMQAKEELIRQKPLIYAYLGDDGRDVIVGEDAAMGVMYSGDALLMMQENNNLEYSIPKEGSNIWYDSIVIPKRAKHKEEAYKFIDYMLRPDVAAKNAIYCVGYTSPVKGVKDLLPEEIRDSKVSYPDFDKLPPLEAFRDLGEYVEIYDRIWTELGAS